LHNNNREQTWFQLRNIYNYNQLWKAFDKTDRNNLWNILLKFSNPTHITDPMKCIYNNNTTHTHIYIYIYISGKISEETSQNPKVRQGYGLSPTLLNDIMLWIGKVITNPGTQMNNTFISTLLFADDQIIPLKIWTLSPNNSI